MSASSLTLRLAAAASVLAVGAAAATTLQQLPKGAHAGECFSRATTPAVYRTERIPLAQPPLVSWREVPAVYRTTTHQVLVTAGRTDRETIPAVMSTRIKWIEHPGQDRVVEAAPVYRWVSQRMLVSPAKLVWKRGSTAHGYSSANYGGSDYGQQTMINPTGEVICRVRVPARYEIRRVRVVVTPGRTCIVKGPAMRERIVERFVLKPAHTVEHKVAPVYRTVSERVLVSPARREKVTTPQAPRFIEKRVLVTSAHTGWTRIVCAPPKAGRIVHPARIVTPAPAPVAPPPVRAPHQSYGVQLQPGDPGYGQAPVYSQGRGYRPDYAAPRPSLQGEPKQPSYHAPRPGYGEPTY